MPRRRARRVAAIGWSLSDPSIHSSRSHVKAARVFRRTNSEPETPTTDLKAGGKGRPTPTRKEAEAAARARAKVPRTRKEQAAAQRAARGDTSRKMRAGDEDRRREATCRPATAVPCAASSATSSTRASRSSS